VRAVHLPVDVAGINEEDGVRPDVAADVRRRILPPFVRLVTSAATSFRLVEEPQVAVDFTAVFAFAFEAVDGEVQATEASGFVGFLGAVDGEFGGGRTAVPYLSV